MGTVIYVALGVVVGIFLAPVVLYFAIKLLYRLFLKKLIDAFSAMGGGGIPPFRLELERVDNHKWHNPKPIERLTKAFARRGFQQAGDFTLFTSPVVTARAFANPEASFYALVYDWPEGVLPDGARLVIDAVAASPGPGGEIDATTYTVSNAPIQGLDSPPWKLKASLDVGVENASLAVGAFVDKLQEMTAGKPLLATAVDDFERHLKYVYAREMDWQVERGGLQREEIIRNATAVHDVDETDDETLERLVQTTQLQWRAGIAEFVSEKTRERFLRRVTKMSAGEWEDARDRLYVVHDRSMPDALKAELVRQITYDRIEDADPDDEQIEEEAFSQVSPHFDTASPREAFASAQNDLPAGRRYKRLARITAPWPADVYLEPEVAD